MFLELHIVLVYEKMHAKHDITHLAVNLLHFLVIEETVES